MGLSLSAKLFGANDIVNGDDRFSSPVDLLNNEGVLWSTDLIMNKVQTHNGNHSRLQRVSHCALVAVFLFSIVNPAMAGMNNMVMSTAMDMSVSMHINMGQDMAEAVYDVVYEEMDCEKECNCCPGVCSAYLPVNYTAAVFFAEKFIHNKIKINAEATTIVTLFRPPIIR